MLSFERMHYKGWNNCFRLSNGQIELLVTGDVGPRILRFGFSGEHNEFCEFEEYLGLTGGDEWRIYGGHRLWHAPEIFPRTYYPDNAPISVEQHGSVVHVDQPTEPTTGIHKSMEITLSPDRAHVQIIHRLCNEGHWEVRLAPWALSVMAPGGVGIFPHPPKGTHGESLLPSGSLVLWAYTDMSDPRFTWGDRYILLRQDATRPDPLKIGMTGTAGWAAYANRDHLFVKTYPPRTAATYPDMGSAVETFTNNRMLEVETLGPLVELAPGAAVEHTEQWYLFRAVPMPSSDADVIAHILPLVQTLPLQQGRSGEF